MVEFLPLDLVEQLVEHYFSQIQQFPPSLPQSEGLGRPRRKVRRCGALTTASVVCELDLPAKLLCAYKYNLTYS